MISTYVFLFNFGLHCQLFDPLLFSLTYQSISKHRTYAIYKKKITHTHTHLYTYIIPILVAFLVCVFACFYV
ncbi:hypothetical protein F4703DRAFT_1899245 [Phycomyces blakesleeanus]